MLSVCIWDFILWSVTRHQSLRNLAFDLIFVLLRFIYCVCGCAMCASRDRSSTHIQYQIYPSTSGGNRPARSRDRPESTHTEAHSYRELPWGLLRWRTTS